MLTFLFFLFLVLCCWSIIRCFFHASSQVDGEEIYKWKDTASQNSARWLYVENVFFLSFSYFFFSSLPSFRRVFSSFSYPTDSFGIIWNKCHGFYTKRRWTENWQQGTSRRVLWWDAGRQQQQQLTPFCLVARGTGRRIVFERGGEITGKKKSWNDDWLADLMIRVIFKWYHVEKVQTADEKIIASSQRIWCSFNFHCCCCCWFSLGRETTTIRPHSLAIVMSNRIRFLSSNVWIIC